MKIPPNTAAINLLSRAAQRLATWTKGPWERGWKGTVSRQAVHFMQSRSETLHKKPCATPQNGNTVISSKSLFYFPVMTLTRIKEAVLQHTPIGHCQAVCCLIFSKKKKKESVMGREEGITSFPRGIPLPRAHVRPMTLAMNVLKVKYSFRTTPLRMVFISGMPEPGKRRREWMRKRKENMKESNYREKDGWREKLISINMHITSEVHSTDFLSTQLVLGGFMMHYETN